jgi:tRNA A-37 threonylcarbamoyl transferase component Bud32
LLSKSQLNHIILSPHYLNELIERKESFHLKKTDVKTTVGVLRGAIVGLPHDILVKRFNYKNFSHFLFKKIFGSRAIHLWKVNQRLYNKKLPVSMPIMYFEPSFRLKHSFFVSSVIENADNLDDIYKKGMFAQNRKIANELGKTIAHWHMAGAVHKDMKWSNILIQWNDDTMRFFFVDLDQAKLYRQPQIKGMMKDLKQFYRDGLIFDAERWVRSQFFPEYFSHIPIKLRSKIDLESIKIKAINDLKRKK